MFAPDSSGLPSERPLEVRQHRRASAAASPRSSEILNKGGESRRGKIPAGPMLRLHMPGSGQPAWPLSPRPHHTRRRRYAHMQRTLHWGQASKSNPGLLFCPERTAAPSPHSTSTERKEEEEEEDGALRSVIKSWGNLCWVKQRRPREGRKTVTLSKIMMEKNNKLRNVTGKEVTLSEAEAEIRQRGREGRGRNGRKRVGGSRRESNATRGPPAETGLGVGGGLFQISTFVSATSYCLEFLRLFRAASTTLRDVCALPPLTG